MVVDASLAPTPEQAALIRATAAPYLSEDLQRNPRRFFDFLEKMPDRMPVPISERLRRTVSGGVIVSRQFLSNYQRYFETEAEALAWLRNQ